MNYTNIRQLSDINQNTFIIGITAQNYNTVIDKARQSNINEVLTKPIDRETVLGVIEKLLANSM